MIRHVDDSFLIGGSCVVNVYSIVVGQGVDNSGFYLPWKVVVLIRRDKAKLYCVFVDLLSIINFVLPARKSAMQTMSIIVSGKLDGFVSYFEASLINTICITSDGCTVVSSKGFIVRILGKIVLSQYHVM